MQKETIAMPKGTFNTPGYKAEIDAMRKRMALSLAAQKNHHARQFILDTLARGVTVEDLERIAKAMPFILQEAVRELNGEVEYKMAWSNNPVSTANRSKRDT
jgi:hypothetical protein